MRKWRPPDISAEDEWAIKYQVVIPKAYQVEHGTRDSTCWTPGGQQDLLEDIESFLLAQLEGCS